MDICRRDSHEVGVVLCNGTYRGSDDTHDDPGRGEGTNIFCFHGIPLDLSMT
jgi:hypothetical protein